MHAVTRIFIVVATFSLTACTTSPLKELPKNPDSKRFAESIPTPTRKVPEPSETLSPPQITLKEIQGIRFQGIRFDSRSHRLRVADQARGPGTQFSGAAAAARGQCGLAAINAGFFTPEGSPLGLVVTAGKTTGVWNGSSSLGSGIWYLDRENRSGITRREGLGKYLATTMQELIQAGPLLIEHSRIISGLEATKVSARSVILWDGGHQWWIGSTSPCSLAALSSALFTASPTGWKVRHALNLDGGRSTDLWISADVDRGPLSQRTPWNRPVRNFLVLTKR